MNIVINTRKHTHTLDRYDAFVRAQVFSVELWSVLLVLLFADELTLLYTEQTIQNRIHATESRLSIHYGIIDFICKTADIKYHRKPI